MEINVSWAQAGYPALFPSRWTSRGMPIGWKKSDFSPVWIRSFFLLKDTIVVSVTSPPLHPCVMCVFVCNVCVIEETRSCNQIEKRISSKKNTNRHLYLKIFLPFFSNIFF
jgi:hypothetical protein